MDEQAVREAYADPRQAYGRSGPKIHADLIILQIAILDELRAIRESLVPTARDPRSVPAGH